jgi:hypothetical protein
MSTANQQQTQRAREAFAAKFSTPEERTEYFREMGRRSAERRRGSITLLPEEAEALSGAYDVLRKIAERTRKNGGGDA